MPCFLRKCVVLSGYNPDGGGFRPWELQGQRGVRAAEDKAQPGFLQTSSTSSKEGVGMIELLPWK